MRLASEEDVQSGKTPLPALEFRYEPLCGDESHAGIFGLEPLDAAQADRMAVILKALVGCEDMHPAI